MKIHFRAAGCGFEHDPAKTVDDLPPKCVLTCNPSGSIPCSPVTKTKVRSHFMSSDIKSLGSFVWFIAELIHGDFKQSEYGKVILPFILLRRMDCGRNALRWEVDA